MTISLQHVTVSVDGPRRILDDVTLELTEQRIGIVGDNGSGKSTLLRLIDGLIAPTAGRVVVDGFDTATAARSVRRLVGFVFTDAMAQLLAPTAVEDVELSLRPSIRDRKERTARAQEWLERWGLGDLAHHSVYDLSGGERQLVALTSVLAVQPRIVLADEPTTLLDLTNRLRLREVFRGLAQQVVVATHDLDFARDMDRVIVLDDGRVAFDAAADEAVAFYQQLAGTDHHG